MKRLHTRIAAWAATVSMALCAISSQGAEPQSTEETPSTSEQPVVRLLAPLPDMEAVAPTDPSSPSSSRGQVRANRPLGLGFPGGHSSISRSGKPRPTNSASTDRNSREVILVQGTDSGSQFVEIPVTPSEPEALPPVEPLNGEDPPPPSSSTSPPRTNRVPVDPQPDTPHEPSPIPLEMNEERAAVSQPAVRHSSSELAGASSLAPPYIPANSDPDALPWTAPYEDRAAKSPLFEALDPIGDNLTGFPTGYMPWWEQELPQSLRPQLSAIPVDLDTLVTGALQYAPQVLSIRTQPEINHNILLAEDAAFDWSTYVESKWNDLNDPVGNTLTTGNNSDRFVDQIATVQAGVRRRTQSGGEFDAFQKWGWQDNNSTFFVPAPQGTTRLQLNYTQPLLQGAGVAYNQSRIVMAQIELNRSFDVVQEELQDHLVKVVEAYWNLYSSRAIYLQRLRVYQRADTILELLDGRGEVDALQRQINRAKAAVASRRSEIIRAQSAIRNAESRLRLLVNDPQFHDLSEIELIPIESPRTDHVPLSLAGSLQQALQNRPDISQAVHDLRSAGVRLGVSQNELLPKLDLVLSAYVAGLQGNHDILGAWGNQFAEGRPGYTVGTVFEMPLGNRAAKARQNRRQWELTKTVHDFRTTVETGLTEVELSVREAETSYREMLSKFQSLVASETESDFLEDRWKLLPGGDRGTTLLLEDLLDAQQREADSEAELVQSQVAYSLAVLRVRRTMGTLIIAQNPTRYEDEEASNNSTDINEVPETATPEVVTPPELAPTEKSISTTTPPRKSTRSVWSTARTPAHNSSSKSITPPKASPQKPVETSKSQSGSSNAKQSSTLRMNWFNRTTRIHSER